MSAPTNPRRRWIPRWLKLLLGSALVPVLIYAYVAWRYRSNPPRPTRNYVAEYNAEIAKTPEDQRAWPRYREAYKKLEPILEDDGFWDEQLAGNPDAEHVDGDAERATDHDDDTDEDEFDDESRPRPIRRLSDLDADRCQRGGPDWDNTVAYLRQHQDTLAEIRAAAELPCFGYVLSDGRPAEDAWPPGVEIPGSENPIVMNTLLLGPQRMRDLCWALQYDAHRAMVENQPRTAATDIVAILRIAEQVRSVRTDTSDLVAVTIHLMAASTMWELLQSFPEGFTPDELQTLEDAFDSVASASPFFRYELISTTFDDAVQRVNSDDGEGDGHFCYDAFVAFIGEGQVSWQEKLLAPLAKERFPSRREINALYDELEELAHEQYAKPFWQADFAVWHALRDTLADERRYALLEVFLIDASVFYELNQAVQVRRQALLLILAMHRYHADHGQWPSASELLAASRLDDWPLDPFDGLPLRYQRTAGGPLLYSVGVDRIDNNGHPAELNTTDSDDQATWQGLDFAVYQRAGTGDWVVWPSAELKEPRPGSR